MEVITNESKLPPVFYWSYTLFIFKILVLEVCDNLMECLHLDWKTVEKSL